MSNSELSAAMRFLKSNFQADIRFDEHITPIRFIIAPDGFIIAPMMVAMLQSFDTVLFVPEAVEDSMEIMVDIQAFEEDSPEGGAMADRWRIYHGEPDDVRWGRMTIDCARYGGLMFDGDALSMANPFADIEASICRTFNTERKTQIKQLCEDFKKLEVEDPICVGADALGIDVRTRFGVIRVPIDAPVDSAEALFASLDDLLERSS